MLRLNEEVFGKIREGKGIGSGWQAELVVWAVEAVVSGIERGELETIQAVGSASLGLHALSVRFSGECQPS